MAEYIERSEIFRVWKNIPFPASVTSLSAAIHQTPAADVAPVRHGRWKRYGKNLGECSECGEIVSVKNNYCPACGCLML